MNCDSSDESEAPDAPQPLAQPLAQDAPRPAKRRRGDTGEADAPLAKKARKLSLCVVCTRTMSATEMRTHRHEEERPHACREPGCAKQYSTIATLAAHMRWHKRVQIGRAHV